MCGTVLYTVVGTRVFGGRGEYRVLIYSKCDSNGIAYSLSQGKDDRRSDVFEWIFRMRFELLLVKKVIGWMAKDFYLWTISL